MSQNTKLFLCIIIISFPFHLEAAPDCEQWMAKLVSSQGKVDKQRQYQEEWIPVKKDELFCQGDRIRTQRRSRVTFELGNESLVTLEQSSALTFPVLDKGNFSWLLELFQGGAFFRSRSIHQLDINTPFVNAVHEGTEFMVKVTDQHTEIFVFDGRVAAENKAGRVKIEKGQVGVTGKDQITRVQPLTIQPKDAVQWALYYPPIVDYQSLSSILTVPAIQKSLGFYEQGDVYQALSVLDNLPEAQQDQHYFGLKASLLLTVGSVDEALQEIEQGQHLKATSSTTYAIKAIIAVTKNQPDQALTLAQKATELSPRSAVAKIALSYAYQANFKIPEALKATEQAVEIAPDNALAWARLAELQLSTGERSDALESAQKAQRLNPQLDRTQTILGFAYLAQIDIDEAKTAYTQAINLNSADPLARLGLGLAKIRKGAIKEGTRDLETAVSLDPNNAIMRSYLGKAYYELRNEGYAATELSIAKDMDPNDPTPWFYDAILKQTTNRPIEALHDMQKAIELNDNRGVYRSKLLLDEDLAARGANLGRIYNDLGFQQLGLVEGWKSVTIDPSNYSAHRLLADNYAAKPQHEVARASELLQSQLLQPINVNPVQPRLSESKLLTLSSGNPSDSVVLENGRPTFNDSPIQPRLAESDRLVSNTLGSSSLNEYNSLFERNQFTFQGSGIISDNDSYGDEFAHTGLWNKLSYSVSQFHFQSNDIGGDNSFKQNIFNAFAQYQVTSDLNMQFEYRYNFFKKSDLKKQVDAASPSSFFDPFSNSFPSSLQMQDSSEHLYRIGANFQPDSTSNILLSGVYTKINDDLFASSKTSFQIGPFDIGLLSLEKLENNTNTLSLELQYIKNLQWVKFVLGAGYIHANSKQNILITDEIQFGIGQETFNDKRVLVEISSNEDLAQPNAYLYSYPSYNNLTATLGVSFDSINGLELPEIQKISPKLGLLWNVTNSTTVRAAYFQGIKKTLNANQTIEPVQIAGFVQFFDGDFGIGTQYEHYGLGLDHKFNQSLYMGLEGTYREFEIPIVLFSTPEVEIQQQNEFAVRSYVNWTPTKQISASLEYQLSIEHRKSNQTLADFGLSNESDVVTHQVPFSINYFARNGFYSKFRATYVQQKIKRKGISNSGKENFWTVDALLGYRLPKRYGRFEFGVKNLFDENLGKEFTNRDNVQGSLSNTTNSPFERTFFSQLVFDFDI